jgi:hypothetical protein
MPSTRRRELLKRIGCGALTAMLPSAQPQAAGGEYTLFWGDLHNHNSVGYARGSLERTYEIAKEHLDFLAFTPFGQKLPRRGSVLVQREMESGRSPLVSIARASVCRVARPNATATGTKKRRTETATGFKRRSGWITIGAPSAPDAGIIAPRPGCMLGMRADNIIEAKDQLARKRSILNPGCAARSTG